MGRADSRDDSLGDADISEIEGKTFTSITTTKDQFDVDDEILFVSSNGEEYKMYHEYDCCENVYIDDICGDLSDLENSPILLAEEVSSDSLGFTERPKDDGDEEDTYVDESYTWTFYKISTIKGSVTIRWYGSSNGYYSEGVNFDRTK